MSLVIMKCYQACGCQKKAGEESVKGKRFVQMPINYLRSPPSKGELAIKWLHNIGTSHTDSGNIQFQPENGLPGPCHR